MYGPPTRSWRPHGSGEIARPVQGTFVLYDVSLFDLENFCDLAQFEVGRGRGSFTRTDNNLTGVGPGMNSFGFVAQARLALTDGGRATFRAVMRWIYDGVDARLVVDEVELK